MRLYVGLVGNMKQSPKGCHLQYQSQSGRGLRFQQANSIRTSGPTHFSDTVSWHAALKLLFD